LIPLIGSSVFAYIILRILLACIVSKGYFIHRVDDAWWEMPYYVTRRARVLFKPNSG
jgi:hypothetical protein